MSILSRNHCIPCLCFKVIYTFIWKYVVCSIDCKISSKEIQTLKGNPLRSKFNNTVTLIHSEWGLLSLRIVKFSVSLTFLHILYMVTAAYVTQYRSIPCINKSRLVGAVYSIKIVMVPSVQEQWWITGIIKHHCRKVKQENKQLLQYIICS